MACDPQTFNGVSPEGWAAMKEEARRQLGISLAADSGEASEKGFTISWNYDGAAQRLTITCLDKPFFVPCGTVNSQIAKLVANVST